MLLKRMSSFTRFRSFTQKQKTDYLRTVHSRRTVCDVQTADRLIKTVLPEMQLLGKPATWLSNRPHFDTWNRTAHFIWWDLMSSARTEPKSQNSQHAGPQGSLSDILIPGTPALFRSNTHLGHTRLSPTKTVCHKRTDALFWSMLLTHEENLLCKCHQSMMKNKIKFNVKRHKNLFFLFIWVWIREHSTELMKTPWIVKTP